MTVALAFAGLVSFGPMVDAAEPQGGRAATRCGVERWAVKTLTDDAAREINFHPRRTSVQALRALPDPHIGRDDPRTGLVEQTTYSVRARLIEFAIEDDSDVHLVIAAPGSRRRTMIAEFPATGCTRGAPAPDRRKMKRARAVLLRACGRPTLGHFRDLRGTASLTGVGFLDVKHGQRGLSKRNGIELHPVLSFRLRSRRC